MTRRYRVQNQPGIIITKHGLGRSATPWRIFHEASGYFIGPDWRTLREAREACHEAAVETAFRADWLRPADEVCGDPWARSFSRTLQREWENLRPPSCPHN